MFHMSQPDLLAGPHTLLLSGHEPADCLALSQGPSQRSFAGGCCAGRGSQHNSLLLSQPLGGSQGLSGALSGVFRPGSAPLQHQQRQSPSQRSLPPSSNPNSPWQPPPPQHSMMDPGAAAGGGGFASLQLGRASTALRQHHHQHKASSLMLAQRPGSAPSTFAPALHQQQQQHGSHGGQAPGGLTTAGGGLGGFHKGPTGSSLAKGLGSTGLMMGGGGLAGSSSRFGAGTRPLSVLNPSAAANSSFGRDCGGGFRRPASVLPPADQQQQQQQQFEDLSQSIPCSSQQQQQVHSMLAAQHMQQHSATPDSMLAPAQRLVLGSLDAAAAGPATESFEGTQVPAGVTPGAGADASQAGLALTDACPGLGGRAQPQLAQPEGAGQEAAAACNRRSDSQAEGSHPDAAAAGAGPVCAGSGQPAGLNYEDPARTPTAAQRAHSAAAVAAKDAEQQHAAQQLLLSRICSLEELCSSMSAIVSRDIPLLLRQQADSDKALQDLMAAAADSSLHSTGMQAQLVQLSASVASFVGEFRQWQLQQQANSTLVLSHAACQTTPGLSGGSGGAQHLAAGPDTLPEQPPQQHSQPAAPLPQPTGVQHGSQGTAGLAGSGGSAAQRKPNSLASFLFPQPGQPGGTQQQQQQPQEAVASPAATRCQPGKASSPGHNAAASGRGMPPAAAAAAAGGTLGSTAAPPLTDGQSQQATGKPACAAGGKKGRAAAAGKKARGAGQAAGASSRSCRDRKPSAKAAAVAAAAGAPALVQSKLQFSRTTRASSAAAAGATLPASPSKGLQGVGAHVYSRSTGDSKAAAVSPPGSGAGNRAPSKLPPARPVHPAVRAVAAAPAGAAAGQLVPPQARAPAAAAAAAATGSKRGRSGQLLLGGLGSGTGAGDAPAVTPAGAAAAAQQRHSDAVPCQPPAGRAAGSAALLFFGAMDDSLDRVAGGKEGDGAVDWAGIRGSSQRTAQQPPHSGWGAFDEEDDEDGRMMQLDDDDDDLARQVAARLARHRNKRRRAALATRQRPGVALREPRGLEEEA